ncbi:hypothetical protein [uncultured Demequina sp.]|uniref:hypothetical protein n=1 Tax=uncultured Demequina sp. TaxID=693499 RepID=UPI0025F411DF|nr:hypothetical protein [uncultured Demequina sp.]
MRISRGLFVNHVEAAVRVVLSGDAGAAGVTGVRVRISLDAKRAFPVPPAFDAGSWGWTFLGAGLHGDRRVFDFVYAGALVAPGGLTTELGIHFSGWWAPGRPQDMTFQAFGVRDAATVESSPVTAGA